jgi:two-component system cell cycle sensor histidine kinase/response regulator CckA
VSGDVLETGVVLQDRSGAILACDEAAERLLGVAREQMTGAWRAIREDGTTFPPDAQPLAAALATGRPQRNVRMGVHRSDGTLSWIAASSLPLFHAGEDAPFAAVCTLSDVTRGVESEHRYRRIVETSMDGVWIVDIDTGACEFANQRMAEILDTTLAELHARPLWSWFDPEDVTVLRARQAERAGGKRGTYDLRFRKRDGAHVYCSVAACPLDGSDGRRLALAMIRDLTETRRAADDLAQTQARIQQAFEVAKIGWFEDDFTAGEAVASPELAAICGWAPGLAPSHAAWDALIHPDDRAAQRELHERAIAPGGPGRLSSEFRIVRPDGATRWVSATARVERDAATGRPRLVGVVMDVTERKQLEEHLLESRKLESLGRLAGGVAHDMNNLLTAIFASLRMAERSAPEAQRGELATIRTAADRAAALVRQLLAFARKQVIELRAIDLNGMVGDLEGMLRRLLGERIDLECRLSPDLWTVRADLSQVEQVLLNLVVNARDAMAGGGTLTLSTRNATVSEADAATAPELAPGEYVVLEAADDGVGIEETALAHIFEPFFTTKPTGTGLGLASSYGTIRQLGGHIAARSRRDEGATFTVYLPRWSGAPRRRSAGNDETLLLVEDDPLLRDVVARGLTELGYRVLAARDGQEALAIAERHPGAIHLVISDVLMPRLSGQKLAERLRESRPAARVLFVSGYAGDVAPGMDLLAKPFTIDALAARVREILDRAAPSS